MIFGSDGYVGRAFVAEMRRRNKPFNTLQHTAQRIWKWLEAFKPSLVINCAAFVCKPSVDLNDDHKAETLLGNLIFPTILADACDVTGTPLLHVSTGCLYIRQPKDEFPDARRRNLAPLTCNEDAFAFKETDEPMLTFDKGAGFYVGSKEVAERVVRQHEKHWICRIRLPFDQFDNPRNYITKLLTYPKILDAYNSISHRGDFVKACLDLVELGAPFGTYNMTNPGAVWACEICEMLRKQGLKKDFQFWDWNEFMMTCAKTKKSNAELDVSKLLATGVKMRPVREALEDSIKRWQPAST